MAASSLVIEQFQYAFTQGSLGRFPLYVANHVSLPILETAAYLSRASVVRHCKGRMRGQCSQSTAGISLSKCQGAVPLPLGTPIPLVPGSFLCPQQVLSQHRPVYREGYPVLTLRMVGSARSSGIGAPSKLACGSERSRARLRIAAASLPRPYFSSALIVQPAATLAVTH